MLCVFFFRYSSAESPYESTVTEKNKTLEEILSRSSVVTNFSRANRFQELKPNTSAGPYYNGGR